MNIDETGEERGQSHRCPAKNLVFILEVSNRTMSVLDVQFKRVRSMYFFREGILFRNTRLCPGLQEKKKSYSAAVVWASVFD